MADINAVAQQFTSFYYATFDSNRSNLASLYVRPFPFPPPLIRSLIADLSLPPSSVITCSPPKRDGSMLTFEGSPYQGVGPIIEKLTVNPFTSATCFSTSHILFFCHAVANLPESAAQSDHARCTALLRHHSIAHCERDGPPRGKYQPQVPYGLLHSSSTV